MKFTKESLLDALKAKLTANGKKLTISERTLKSHSDTLYAIGVNEETELDAFVSQILPGIETLRGNYEKDNSDFVKEWEKKHPAPKPEEKPETKPTGDDKLDALMAEIKALKEESAASKREKIISEKKASLISVMKEKGIKDSKWLNSYINNTHITEDMDIEGKATSALEFYNLAHATVETETPNIPGNPPANAPKYDDIVSTLKRQRHED